jgi:signal peptidase II
MLRIGLAAVLTLALDQGTKLAVRALLPAGRTQAVIDDWLRLARIENTGIAFGLFRNQPRLVSLGVGLAPLGIAAIGRGAASPLGTIGVGLILGGWAGNVVDRVTRGSVTDFVDAGVGTLRWPSFNLADAAILAGVLLLALGEASD